MTSWTEAAVVTRVGTTGALSIDMAAISLVLAQSVTNRTVLLQITTGVKVFVQGSACQRFELFVAIDDVRVLLLRL